MPPRSCLRSLPLRIRDGTALSAPPRDARWFPSQLQSSSFSTSIPSAYPMPPKKKVSAEGPPKKGVRALRIKKKDRAVRDARPPAPGERKAIRKRIVLSNNNALEVPGLEDLSKLNMIDNSIKGRVMGLPDELVGSLRTVEAFKVGQGWGYFRRPACLIRDEAVELGRLMEEVERTPEESDKRVAGSGIKEYSGQTVRKLIHGERGVGKSVLLLQTMAMAFTRGWVVINFPEGRDITIGHTDYSPLPNTDPKQYSQKAYTANLLSQIVKANTSVLSGLQITQDHSHITIPIQENISLDRFADLGAQNPDIAWPILQGLWSELMAPKAGRPPVFLGLDNISHILTDSHYTTVDASGKLKPIHAHDLVLVKHFMDYLSGAKTMPNGGLVVASTSLSDHAKSPALDVSIAMAEARQTADPPLSSTDALRIEQFWSPYKMIDQRSVEALKDIETIRLEGLKKEEARAIMEYWATSGMVRKEIGDGFVTEKWSLAGGGVVGELEKAVVRSGRL